jgi:tetratricopeptide (TPR) repeat protein
VIDLKGEHWDVWLYRGEAHEKLNDWKAVITDLSRARELGADDEMRLEKRGWAYLRLGRSDEALADFKRYIDRYPQFWMPWTRRGSAHAEQGWRGNAEARKKAEADFAQAVKLGAPPVVQTLHAFCWLALDDRDGYAKACAAMLKRGGKSPNPVLAIWTLWACLAAREGSSEPQRLEGLARRLVEARPKSRTYQFALGAALVRAKKPKEAIAPLLEARALYTGVDPPTRPDDDSDALDLARFDLFFLAMAHKQAGDEAKAQQFLAEAEQEVKKTQESTSPDISWSRRLLYQLLLEEAKGVVNGK